MVEFDLMNGFSNSDLMAKAPEEKQGFKADERFWKLTKDKDGTGVAVIRLLPDMNKIPYVRLYHYASKKEINGKEHWLIADSPSTVGLPCPIQEHYFDLMNAGNEDLAKKMYNRKVKYYTNILVVKDPGNPENEGKVFLYSFGTKLLEKFKSWMQPDESQQALGETPKELFHPINGYNIKLVIKKSPDGKFYHYDNTSIDVAPCRVGEPSQKLTNEDIIEIITKKTYDLSEFQKPEHFESYDKLKEKLDRFDKPFGNKKENAVPSATTKTTNDAPFEPTKTTTSSTDASADDDWLNNL